MDNIKVSLFDYNGSRRSIISYHLSRMDIHVEPYENESEIAYRWCNSDALLVYDEPGALKNVIGLMLEADNSLPVIAFAQAPAISRVISAGHQGADHYLSWPFSYSDLKHALVRARIQFDEAMPIKRREFNARKALSQLTRRESQVLACMTNGLSNREMGEQLCISPRTVEVHRANLIIRLGVQRASDAIRMAIEANLERVCTLRKDFPSGKIRIADIDTSLISEPGCNIEYVLGKRTGLR